MKEILKEFLVRIDENGKEVGKPIFGKTYTPEYLEKYKNATEVIKLPTLSEFWKSRKGLIIHGYFARSFDSYVRFVNQPLTKEMFIGEDAMFILLTDEWFIDGFICQYKTIEQALNNNVTLYLNPDKI